MPRPMRFALALAALGLSMSANVADAADKAPSWRRQPTPQDLLSVFPTKALSEGRPGKATIACFVSLEGALHDCAVASESPAGFGFGAAALALAPQLMFNPATHDGVPVADKVVRIPIDFLPPDAPTGGVIRRAGSHGEEMITVLSDVDWSIAPTIAEVDAAFPTAARSNHRGGRATLNCRFRRDGSLGPCDLASSDPENAGFDVAARTLVARFRGPLKLADGRSTAGMATMVVFAFPAPAADGAAPPMGKPRWTALPSGDQLRDAYPAAARTAGVAGGRAVLDCVVGAGGALEQCAVTSQEPANLGFGDAALAIAPSFHAAIWTQDGLPTIGGHLRLPMRFAPPEPPAPAAPPP
jgi:TonB family protein